MERKRWLRVSVVIFLVICASQSVYGKLTLEEENDAMAQSELEHRMDKTFQKYLEKQKYTSGSVGVLYEDMLLYVKGEGHEQGHKVQPETVVPILGLSQFITACAILKLVDQDRLSLDDHVFGHNGILHRIKLGHDDSVDLRLREITVEHLLRHTGGWDASRGPVYDPMLNNLYLSMGAKVVDITKEVNEYGLLNQEDIIQYMIQQPLDFTPGTKVVRSNFGYSLLGRIIEEVMFMPYEVYVTEKILVPSGMWHTKLGPSSGGHKSQIHPHFRNTLPNGATQNENDYQSLFDIVNPHVVDSSLGWFSNIYDLSRLFSSVFRTRKHGLLSDEMVEYILARPPLPLLQYTESWSSIAGFKVKNDGTFYYENPRDSPIGMDIYMYSQNDDTSFIFLGFTEKHNRHLDSFASRMLKHGSGIAQLNNLENLYASDLADSRMNVNEQDLIIKYKLSEHRLSTYMNAIKLAGYYPKWIHAYGYAGHAYFAVISQQASEDDQENLQFNVEIAKSKSKGISIVSKRIEQGYHIRLLQTFLSSAHNERLCHLIFTTKGGEAHDLEFDFESDLQDYISRLEVGVADGFVAVAQSVVVHKHTPYVTYLLQESNHLFTSRSATAKYYHSLSFDELEKTAKENAVSEYSLKYLDTYSDGGKARFSAVFQKGGSEIWMLQSDVALDSLDEETEKWGDMGFTPKLIVGYEYKGNLRYTVLWVVV